jgi:SOS-response transcriptional repressor LexA
MPEQANYGIFQFLESLQGEEIDLPDAIVHSWQRGIKTVTSEHPNWDEARNWCEHMMTVLAALREDNNRDIMRIDKAKGLVSILLGAIHLAQKNHREAVDSFGRGAKYLHRWKDTDFESLAYFGRMLTHKEEKSWPSALEAAQKALDAIRYLPLGDRTSHIERLQMRLEQEIISITEASVEERPPTSQLSWIRSTSSEASIKDIEEILPGLALVVENKKLTLRFDFERPLSVEDFYNAILPTVEALYRVNKALLSLISPAVEPSLIIEKISFSSPFEIKLGEFIPETIEVFRQLFKDLKYRNEAEEERARLEAIGIKLDLVTKWIEVAAPDASPEDRLAIATQILPDMQLFSKFTNVKLIIESKGTETDPEPFESQFREVVWIPITYDIAAGLGRIAQENIEEYWPLFGGEHKGADFGVRVVGDSMKGHGILSGDIALIRQQSGIEMGEIAAVVVTTRTESEGVLKQYYRYEKRADMQHWFLKSSNPSTEHLVIIPSGANANAIRDLYAKDIQAGRIRIYENAELSIAGKYVGLVRNI